MKQSTACILCSENCGLEITVENGTFTKIQGDKKNPTSKGYLCQKASQLNYYQNHKDRLTHPLKKMPDGSFKKVSWDVAVSEVANHLLRLRESYTGKSLAFYGGGGQGNHLGGAFSASLRSAMQTQYHYSALAQEKTGDFWVNGKLFGRQTCHPTDGIDEAELIIFIGTNPWQAHGFPQARKTLQKIQKDPNRKMVVIDPRRTETAERADYHLAVKAGKDAFLLSAILAVIIQEGLEDQKFLNERTIEFEQIKESFKAISVDQYSKIAGIEPKLVRTIAYEIANTKKVTIRADLGIQQSLHSTLNSYLEKLLFLITGNFGKEGCNNFHSFLLPIIGHSDDPEDNPKVWKTVTTGMKPISKFYPPNILPKEIDSKHSQRIRGLVVDSSNPLATAANTQAYRKAFQKLDLLVVIDVAMTETTAMADYILPASSQYEKWEASFFNLTFPENSFQLRKPITEPLAETLPEHEIYRRLIVAMDEIPNDFSWLRRIAKMDRIKPSLKIFPLALQGMLKLKPNLAPYVPIILTETLGDVLPVKAKPAALLWGAAQMYVQKHKKAVQRAGIKNQGEGLAEALFDNILNERSGTAISVHEYEDTWSFLRHPDKKIHLFIPELIKELNELSEEKDKSIVTKEFPFLLMAGERRSYNANTIYRDPKWRKQEQEGTLRIHPEDVKKYGLEDGKFVVCESETGKITVMLESTESAQQGTISLPHGYGLSYTNDNGEKIQPESLINLLTSSDHCDAIAKTPFHKNVPVKISPVI
ncbi:MAG: anaerobic selenocysteine-containing dehydrogenase [bacterium]|jgi:anaerobic selenocysteine-containing dehydrogenase